MNIDCFHSFLHCGLCVLLVFDLDVTVDLAWTGVDMGCIDHTHHRIKASYFLPSLPPSPSLSFPLLPSPSLSFPLLPSPSLSFPPYLLPSLSPSLPIPPETLSKLDYWPFRPGLALSNHLTSPNIRRTACQCLGISPVCQGQVNSKQECTCAIPSKFLCTSTMNSPYVIVIQLIL